MTESQKDHEEASRETFMTACEEQQVMHLPHNQSNTSLNQIRVQEGLRQLKPTLKRNNSNEQMATLRNLMLSLSPSGSQSYLSPMASTFKSRNKSVTHKKVIFTSKNGDYLILFSAGVLKFADSLLIDVNTELL